MRAEARKNIRKAPLPKRIIATDIDNMAIAASKQNAKTAGVDHLIEFDVCDFAETPLPKDPAIILMNPEYSRRMGDLEQLEKEYKRIGDFLKQKCPGHTGCIFTGNRELAKKIGLKTTAKIPFYNGNIECRLLIYNLYKGKK
jgi:putative N6-adenine-specific DNA methylase